VTVIVSLADVAGVVPEVLAAEFAVRAPTWLALLLAVVLLAANAFFVGSEIALLAVRRASIEERAAAGDRRARITAGALRELTVSFSGAQLGITMASLGLGAVAEPAVVRLFEGALGMTPVSPTVRHAIAFAIALSIVVFLHMVIGEMVPKNLALADPERISLRLGPFFRVYILVFRPIIIALNAAANGLVRLLRIEPRDELSLVHTPQELAFLLRESRREGTIAPQDARVLTAALRLGDIDAEAAMTPRVDLRAVSDDAAGEDVLALARETGLTRFPVYHGDLDGIVGVVHVKDVLTRDREELEGLSVAEVLRPIPAVPESRDLDELLREMRRDRSHAVLVVDEFGGTAGVVTLEDILEELVGEIEDEFDPLARDVRRTGQERWVIPGTLRPDELRMHTGCELPEGEYETVSGYLTHELGRLVEPDDEVRSGAWVLRVRSIEGRRAGEVDVSHHPLPGGEDEAED
jgi:CBS domain containing-hemolysin-like protein